MRVLHVVRGLANSSGTTHIVVPLAEEQARQGARVSVYYVAKGREAPVLPDPALVESHCFAQSLPGSNPGFSFSFARAMRANAGSFDIVHAHAVWNFCTYWTMRAAYEAHVPYVVAPQGSFEPWALAQSAMKKRLLGPLTEVPLFNRAAALQALTETEAVQFRRYGLTAPAVVVPNGVDPAKFDRCAPPLARQLGLAPGTATLLFMSRLHPKKGLDILLAAFALIAVALPRLTLVVAGNDAGSGYADELKRLAAALGIGATLPLRWRSARRSEARHAGGGRRFRAAVALGGIAGRGHRSDGGGIAGYPVARMQSPGNCNGRRGIDRRADRRRYYRAPSAACLQIRRPHAPWA